MASVCKHFRIRRLINPKVFLNVNKLEQKCFGHCARFKRKSFNHRTFSFVLATGVFSVACYYAFNGFQKVSLEHLKIFKKLPDVTISRKITGSECHQTFRIIFFQHPACPYCAKVKAYFDYKGLSYDVVEVNPLRPSELHWSEIRNVPTILLEVKGGFIQLFDSTMIISALASFFNDPNQDILEVLQIYPFMERVRSYDIEDKYTLLHDDTPPQVVKRKQPVENTFTEERKWRQWADTTFNRAITANIYRTWEESLQAFEYFSQVGDWYRLFPNEAEMIIYTGAYTRWQRMKPKGDHRKLLYVECEKWMEALRLKKTKFMGGDMPNLADLAVFGYLSMLEGCIVFNDVIDNTDIGTWYYPLKEMVDYHRGSDL